MEFDIFLSLVFLTRLTAKYLIRVTLRSVGFSNAARGSVALALDVSEDVVMATKDDIRTRQGKPEKTIFFKPNRLKEHSKY